MESIINDSINYLKTTKDTDWNIFLDKHVMLCDNSTINHYLLHIRKDLIYSINHMKLVVFPAIKMRSNYFELAKFQPFFSYFSDEKEALILIKKVLQHKTSLSDNFSNFQISGILLHTLGNNHTDNQKHLVQALEIERALNKGFEVYVDEDRIQPVNHQLVKSINNRISEKLYNKKSH